MLFSCLKLNASHRRMLTSMLTLSIITGSRVMATPAHATDSSGRHVINHPSRNEAVATPVCPSTPIDQDFTGYTNTAYPATITLGCILYSTSGGTGNVGVDNAVGGGISDGPVFSGNALVMTFSTLPSPAYADFKSTSNTINFKMASLDVEFFGHLNGNCAETYNIIGYDNGLAVATVNSFNVTTSGTYGSGNAAIVYNRNAFNTSHNNTGSLTFGALWANIDEVRFVVADAAPYDNLFVAVDNLNFEPAIVLPVSLTNFIASQGNGTALLKWQTASEQNTQNFTLQNSGDGANWHNLATLNAAGNSNTKKDYSYVQQNPAKGNNYYRLLQTDINGNNTYSETRLIKIEEHVKSFALINNSASSREFQVQVNEPTTLSLFNASGVLMKKIKYTPGLQLLDLGNYSSGLYFLRSRDVTAKIVVQ
jgi:hypothetical protein